MALLVLGLYEPRPYIISSFYLCTRRKGGNALMRVLTLLSKNGNYLLGRKSRDHPTLALTPTSVAIHFLPFWILQHFLRLLILDLSGLARFRDHRMTVQNQYSSFPVFADTIPWCGPPRLELGYVLRGRSGLMGCCRLGTTRAIELSDTRQTYLR